MKAAELDPLASAAAAADKGIPPEVVEPGEGGSASPGAAGVDPAVAWAQFPALFGRIVTPAMPELAGVYSEQACMEWGRAMVPLAEKYGWSPGAFMEWLGPWAGVVMATWPLAWPTIKAIRARRAADPAAGDAGAAPGSEKATVTPIRPAAAESGDPDLRDPTETNRPPRPA